MSYVDMIFNMDCLEGMKAIPDASVDLIITDPPYDFMTKHMSMNRTFADAFKKFSRPYHKELQEACIIDGFDRDAIMRECVRIMKKVNIYIWCNKDQIRWYLNFFKDYNMDILTWHKINPTPTSNNKYLSDTEYLLFFRERGVKIHGTYDTKKKYWFQEINREDKKIWSHPTIKPLNIIETLLINSSQEGDIILDPFIGSGTTAVACIKQKRHYIGFEINKDYYDTALRRTIATRRHLTLF